MAVDRRRRVLETSMRTSRNALADPGPIVTTRVEHVEDAG
jgi:hypothetical protein